MALLLISTIPIKVTMRLATDPIKHRIRPMHMQFMEDIALGSCFVEIKYLKFFKWLVSSF
jgi:hypothetical protein